MRAKTDAESQADAHATSSPTRLRPSLGADDAIIALQRSAGNQAVGRLLVRREEAGLKGFAGAIGAGNDAQTDEVDGFLVSRRRLYDVTLVGTNVHAILPRSHEWTARYTNRALFENAIGAVIEKIYGSPYPTAAEVKKGYERAVGEGVTYRPATEQTHGQGALYLAVLHEGAMATLAEAFNKPRKYMSKSWRTKLSEAQMIKLALDEAHGAFDKLVPFFVEEDLAAADINVETIRLLLDNKLQSMIEVAKRHPAAAPWRAAADRNLALEAGDREPEWEDLDTVHPSRWAATILKLAMATRDTINKQAVRQQEDNRKHARNEHLRPHAIKVENVALYTLETFDPESKAGLPQGWEVQGGQQLTNAQNEPIFVLRVADGQVTYQNLSDKRFYQQTFDGFSDELSYGVFASAGQKSYPIIAGVKWMFGIIGAIFPPARYGLLATDVLNAAYQLKENWGEVERGYESFQLAYENVDGLIPGMLPTLWEAVLDPRNLALFNPLKHPDVAAWVKAAVRIAADVVRGGLSVPTEAIVKAVSRVWATVKKTLLAVLKVCVYTVVVGTPVVGSTGVEGGRALKIAEERLKEVGVVKAAMIVTEIQNLDPADRTRLQQEIQDLIANGTNLIEVLGKSLSWG